MNLNTVSNQWATRPTDQRFLNVDELYAKVASRRDSSRVSDVALDHVQVAPDDSGDIMLADTTGETFGQLTHFAFGQLCQRAHVPAGYLRSLPPMLACMNLQWGLESHEAGSDEGNDARLLTRINGQRDIAAVTSPTYGRIWDAEVVDAVRRHVDLDVWKVPAASYSGSDPLRATTLYASDRDVFIFLVNESAGIDSDGGSIKRGVYLWNSEVGSATFGIATFLYDRVCDNRIIWGAKQFRELKIRHTSGGPHRFIARAVPELKAYAESSARIVESTIRAAKAKEVGRDRKSVQEWMKARGFTTPQARQAWDAAESEPRNYNPASLWGVVQGMTDSAKELKNTDERTDLERKAGSLLDIVADE
ncbi:MAG: DUF932 domain-containing protein [Methanomassiliicoccales archaeon]|nr:DUF932 domain-containing protein [Methanomassiliicoccales archaeon]